MPDILEAKKIRELTEKLLIWQGFVETKSPPWTQSLVTF